MLSFDLDEISGLSCKWERKWERAAVVCRGGAVGVTGGGCGFEGEGVHDMQAQVFEAVRSTKHKLGKSGFGSL